MHLARYVWIFHIRRHNNQNSCQLATIFFNLIVIFFSTDNSALAHSINNYWWAYESIGIFNRTYVKLNAFKRHIYVLGICMFIGIVRFDMRPETRLWRHLDFIAFIKAILFRVKCFELNLNKLSLLIYFVFACAHAVFMPALRSERRRFVFGLSVRPVVVITIIQ